ncbi:MAG: SDR family oxidoreductase, partial [Salibacteraceae bacterium]
EKGYKVYGTTRNPQKFADQTLPFTMVAMDVEQDASVQQAVNEVLNHEERIDILVNNAGVAVMGPLEDTSIKQARKVYETNVLGIQRTIMAVLPTMRYHGGGTIINVSSIAGQFGLPYRSIYSASKAAVGKLIESIHYELAPLNIKVVLVEPGDVKTAINDHRAVAEGSSSKGVYEKAFQHVAKGINEDVSHGISPVVVSQCIEKIIRNPNPRIRYIVSPLIPKLAVILNHLLPSWAFQWIIRKNAGI